MTDTDYRAGERRSRHAWTVSCAALATGIALLLISRFAWDSWLARFDMFTFFVPWYAHLGARLREFEIPGWNPSLFSGTPFAGDPESGWMYLPAMISFTLLPVLAGFKAMAALHLAIAGAGAWLLARALGLGPAASLVAGLAFVTAPLLQWNSYCCLVLNQFAVWMPWVLLGTELGLRNSSWRGRIAPWSLAALALSQQFAGFVGQGWILAPLMVAAWAGYRTLLDPARPGVPVRSRLTDAIRAGALVVGGGILLGAAGVLPRLEFNAQSNIPFGDYEAHGAEGILNPPWTLPHLLAQMMGDAYDRRSAAIGGATLVLALLAVPLARKRFVAPFFGGLALLVMVLTLPPTPIHQIVYLIPGMRSFLEHDAWRIWVLAPICFAMLAGIGFEAIRERRGNLGLALIAPLPLLAMAIATWVIAPVEGDIGRLPLAAAALLTIVIIAWAATPKMPQIVLAAAAAGLVFLQPAGFDLTGPWLGWPTPANWESRWHPDPVVRATLESEIQPDDPGGAGDYLRQRMAEDGPFRYVGYGGVGFPGANLPSNYMARRFEPGIHAIMVNGRPMFLGLQETQGYNPLELGRYADFVTAMNGEGQDYHTAYLMASGVGSPMLDLLDARFIVIDNAIPPEREDVRTLRQGRNEVFRNDLVSVWERTPATRRAWIVHKANQSTPRDALAALASGAVDGREVAFLETTLPELRQPPPGVDSTARVTVFEPERIEIAASNAVPGLLVVSEAYEHGWRATVDGNPVPILAANGWMRAIPLPAGEHEIVMRYDPLSLKAGLWITLLTALAMIAGSIWSIRGRRR